MKFVVIGGGLTGLVSSTKLLELGHEVTLILKNQSIPPVSDLFASKYLKSGLNGYDSYDLTDLDFSSPHLFVPSNGFGGYANVWGATWGEFKSLSDQEWKDAYTQANNILWPEIQVDSSSLPHFRTHLEYCDCLGIDSANATFGGNGITGRVTELALKSPNCLCLRHGETSCPHGSILNGYELFDSLSGNSKFRSLITDTPLKIVANSDNVEIHFSSEFIVSDRLILAAGPVGNAQIILGSNLNINSIEINETSMFYLPLLSLRRKRKHIGSFAMSQVRYDLDVVADSKVHMQIYTHPEIYSDRILNFLPSVSQKLLKKPLGLLFRRLNIGIVYWDQRNSAKANFLKGINGISIEIQENSIPFFSKLKFFFNLIKNIQVLYFNVPLPFLKGTLPGASFHVGATKSIDVDEYGVLAEFPNIGVAGSLCLDTIEPGPITFTSIAQAIRLSNWMSQSPKL